VARLLQDLDDDPVAKARFVAVNHTPTGRELLSWDEFCWPSTRSREQAADISKNPGRPRAVWGRVTKAGPARSGRTGFIQLDASDGPPVRLRAKNERYVAEQGLSDFVLGFGANWELFPPGIRDLPRRCGSPSRGCCRHGTRPPRGALPVSGPTRVVTTWPGRASGALRHAPRCVASLTVVDHEGPDPDLLGGRLRYSNRV